MKMFNKFFLFFFILKVRVTSGAGEERLVGEESVETVYQASLYINREQNWKLRRYETRLLNL